ncbi:MAG: hypothetical protein AAFZ63_07760 [Bacteroidota bacterium]
MRSKLQKFTDFTNTLLPHETQYLLSVQQFQDEERLTILQRIDHNAQHISQFTPYDTKIDKRKYNHLKNWITERLSAIDVDQQLSWMLETEQKILTDCIDREAEKKLLKMIRADQQGVFFNSFYELVQHYRHFLLIRLRYQDHQLVDEFLQRNQVAYEQSRAIYEQIHTATTDIVGQYQSQEAESQQWEAWLTEVFYNESLDIYLRHLALVRLTFLCYNYRKYDILQEKFTYLEEQFLQGKYYSRRLLLNFYNSLLMLKSQDRDYEQAVYYGYLSIRAQNHDYPLYVNNLCAVLLRLERHEEALQLMQNTASAVKKTSNFHNRVGFVAFYMEALNRNQKYQNAESYGDNFLRAYSKEVLRYRWHLFFSVYLEALILQEAYLKVIKTAQKYRLLQRDKKYERNASYQAIIPLLIGLAQYKEVQISKKDFVNLIQQYAKRSQEAEADTRFRKLLVNIGSWAPELRRSLRQLNN